MPDAYTWVKNQNPVEETLRIARNEITLDMVIICLDINKYTKYASKPMECLLKRRRASSCYSRGEEKVAKIL